MDDEPQEPGKPAGEPQSVHADDCTAAIDGGHTPKVPILPRHRLGAVFDALSDDVSRMVTRLKGNFCDAREVVANVRLQCQAAANTWGRTSPLDSVLTALSSPVSVGKDGNQSSDRRETSRWTMHPSRKQ